MFLFEQVVRILSDMMKNKLRVFLTMIGIIVGVSSVVLIMSIGSSITNAVKMYFAGSLGDNRFTSYVSAKNGKNFSVKYDELYELAGKLPNVKGPLLESSDYINGRAHVDGEHYSAAVLRGVSPVYSDAHQLIMLCGRFINMSDCKGEKSAAVISNVAAENCFGSTENALGGQLSVIGDDGRIAELTVVGVYKYIDTKGKLEKMADKRLLASDAYCSYEYMNLKIGVDTSALEFEEFTYITDPDVDMRLLVSSAQDILSARYDDPDYSISCYRGFSRTKETNSMLQILILVFAAAAGLSLVVGGISLMNTMLVSVKERTKEIGTRKAIGASNSSIVFQFLLESVVICLVACIFGILFCFLVIAVLRQNLSVLFDLITDDSLKSFMKTNNISISINFLSVLVSVLFSVVVGVLFGVYPAVKAAKMQVTDALRYE